MGGADERLPLVDKNNDYVAKRGLGETIATYLPTYVIRYNKISLTRVLATNIRMRIIGPTSA